MDKSGNEIPNCLKVILIIVVIAAFIFTLFHFRLSYTNNSMVY